MAYEFDPNKSKDDTDQQPETAGTAPTTSSGAPVQQRGTSSGRFTNIQNYINANRGTNLAGQIGNKIQGEADKAKEDIAQSGQQFGQQAEAGRAKYDTGMVQNAINNPAEFAAQEPNVAAFQKQLHAAYGGPQNLTNYAQLQSEAGNVKQLGQMGGTEAGRNTLLNNYFGRGGQYSRGQQNLDNLILQANPNQARQLSQARQYGGQVVNALGQTAGQAQAQAKQFGQEAANTAAQTQQALTGAQTGFETGLNDRLAQEKAAQNELFNQAQTGLSNFELSQPVYDRLTAGLGLTPDTTLYNVNPADYVTKGMDPTLQTIATPEDYARYQALNKLGGQTNTLLYDPTMANQYQTQGPLTYNKEGFQQALQLGKQQFETDPARQAAIAAANYAQNEQELGQAYSDWINSVLSKANGLATPATQGQIVVGNNGQQMSTAGSPGTNYNQQMQQFLNNAENWKNVDWGGTNYRNDMAALPGLQGGTANYNAGANVPNEYKSIFGGFDPRSTPEFQKLSQLIQSGSPGEIEQILALNNGAGVGAIGPQQTIETGAGEQYAGQGRPTMTNPAYTQWLQSQQASQDILGGAGSFSKSLQDALAANLAAKQAAQKQRETELGGFQKIREKLS